MVPERKGRNREEVLQDKINRHRLQCGISLDSRHRCRRVQGRGRRTGHVALIHVADHMSRAPEHGEHRLQEGAEGGVRPCCGDLGSGVQDSMYSW